jgi:MFS family permease
VAAGGGPVVGGLLVEWSWRWIFLINVPLVIASVAAGAIVLARDDAGRGGGRIDGVGTLLALGTMGLVCTALTEMSAWPASRVWSMLAAGVALAAWFVAHILRHPEPVVAPRMFRAGTFSAGAAGLLVYYTGFAALLLGTTLLLVGQWHFSVIRAALGIAPAPLMAAVLSPFTGWLATRFGRPRTILAGAMFFAAAGAWPLLRAGAAPSYVWVVLPSMLLWGLANPLIQPPLFACADAAPPAELASGSAVLSMARQLGSALGVAILVAALGTGHFNRAWLVVLIAAGMTGLAGLGTGSRRVVAVAAGVSGG